MNIEKMRSEFEEWATKSGLSTVRTPQALMFANGQRRAEGDYIMVESLCAWAAWQQSRSSLVIELPTCEYANDASEYSKGHRQGIRACREAIQSTGVKVK